MNLKVGMKVKNDPNGDYDGMKKEDLLTALKSEM